MTERAQPLFSHAPPYGGDSILSLMETCQADTRADKVDLGNGVCFDNEGRLCVSGLTTHNGDHVAQAMAAVLEQT